MKHFLLTLFSLLSIQISLGQNLTRSDYQKKEVYIKMRDGIQLYAAIYAPKDESKDYPVIMWRTPYSCRPYGPDTLPAVIMHNPDLVASGYIFIKQDMRGRWMSEGQFENTKPPYSWSDKKATDEITDAYDTFDWIQKNIKNFNGNIGQIGNSYLGHTSLVSATSGHPNLKAVIAMAPVTNFYFEDFNRYGLYSLNYAPVMDVFGIQKTQPVDTSWYNVVDKNFMIDRAHGLTADYYDYFLQRQALNHMEDVISPNNFFWDSIKAHPDYDAYRQARNWVKHVEKVKCPTMVVGGWTDEQNLYGILNSYQSMYHHRKHKNVDVKLVLGPWSHGHPKRRDSAYYLGNIFYGYDLAQNYQQKIEFNYFEHHLKGKGESLNFSAKVFDMGTREWHTFDTSPFDAPADSVLFLGSNGRLIPDADTSVKHTYIADPNHPVPFIEGNDFHILAPKHYMNDDQRFASKRPDVLTFTSEVLENDVTIRGKIEALIQFASDHEDADLYVKIIDVYPMDRRPEKEDLPGVKMNGYQQLVRVGYIRGRYYNSFSTPEKLEPGAKTSINVPLLDVYHTFKKGHTIMIQIQSSMFPLFDLNPQKWVDNIYEAEKNDFEKAEHVVFGDSQIRLPVVQQ